MTQDPAPASAPLLSNVREFSVSEISAELKQTVEGTFGHVRVRGEISQPRYHGSGHLYLTLRDDKAILAAVCWRNTAAKLPIRAEDGMEVVCTGRLSTYAGQSKYQLIVEAMELAGEGALLKLLEERRRRLAAEGLFDAERKQTLPYLPHVIGVITSPTGAVIRDILHRLADRFPRHVLLWPVAVQGDGAAEQVAQAIAGFNRLVPGGTVPRPDVLIVARGGGSLEDLMAFNEEVVVRAAAGSTIPLISAVGHETDTTLIDHAADRRAPTPTAAAEIAVPVRAELLSDLLDRERRMIGAWARLLGDGRTRLEGLSRGLGDPMRLLEGSMQRLDDRGERLANAPAVLLDRAGSRLTALGARLPDPSQPLAAHARHLDQLGTRLGVAARGALLLQQQRFAATSGRLSPVPLRRLLDHGSARTNDAAPRLHAAATRLLAAMETRLAGLASQLDGHSYERMLDLGYVLVRGEDRRVITSSGEAQPGRRVSLQFKDGAADAVITGSDGNSRRAPPPAAAPSKGRGPAKKGPKDQGSLF